MSKRSLTDELQSVMLAHSFDAPEPSATIDRILAGTVSAGGDGAIEDRRRRRWFPSPKLLGAAAGVAALLVGAAVLNSIRTHANSQSSSAASARSRGSADAAAKQTPGGVTAQGTASGKASLPQLAVGIPTDVTCDQASGSRIGIVQGPDLRINNTGEVLSIFEIYCSSPDGQRTGSQVEVYRTVDGVRQLLATPIAQARQLHLDFITVEGQTMIVRASSWSPEPIAGQRIGRGAVSDYPFSTTNAQTFTAGPPTLVAASCTQTDLTVSVVAGPGVRQTSGLIRFVNKAAQPCAIEGFPSVSVAGRTAAVPLPQILRGPVGGVRQAAVPPIVVLAPGGTATAIIESSAQNTEASCVNSQQLLIALPAGGHVATVPLSMNLCGAKVHPVVEGFSGSD